MEEVEAWRQYVRLWRESQKHEYLTGGFTNGGFLFGVVALAIFAARFFVYIPLFWGIVVFFLLLQLQLALKAYRLIPTFLSARAAAFRFVHENPSVDEPLSGIFWSAPMKPRLFWVAFQLSGSWITLVPLVILAGHTIVQGWTVLFDTVVILSAVGLYVVSGLFLTRQYRRVVAVSVCQYQ